MSRTFTFRPLDSNEAFRWSWTSSLEARSPFEYSMRIPVEISPLAACEKYKNKKESQGVRNSALYGEA